MFWVACGIILITGCGVKRPLPTGPVDAGTTVAAGDTFFTQVKPDWPVGTTFNKPRDIYVNRDGYIFIADYDNSRITVFNKSGKYIESADDFGNKHFEDLTEIPSYLQPGDNVQPTGISMDARMNIFIVDSTNTVYVWNQFLNNVGIDSVVSQYKLINVNNGTQRTVSAEEYWRTASPVDSIASATWTANPAVIDSVLKPRMFFTSSIPSMVSRGNYGAAPEQSRFNAVAAWQPNNPLSPERVGSIYLTDASYYQRIIRVDYRKYRQVKLSTGPTYWIYRGRYNSIVALNGSGEGFVQKPTGLFFNYYNQDPKIYFSQTGGGFGAHRISLTLLQEPDNNGFDLNDNSDIVEYKHFNNARDISSDADGNIYVTNSGNKVVEEYNANGTFLRYLGTEEQRVTATLTDTTINAPGDTTFATRDTVYTVQVPNVFQHPSAVAYGNGVVYVADDVANKVYRFQLSTDVDVNLGQQQQ